MMGLFSKLIKLMARKQNKPPITPEQQDIIDQVVIIQPIIRS